MSCQTQACGCSPQPTLAPRQSESTYRPLVDVIEAKDELLLRADMPGVQAEQLDLDFNDGVLTMTGRVKPRYEQRQKFLRAEFGVGDFSRTFRIGEQIDASRMYAELNDGVLTVHLPKAESNKPRKIEVRQAS